MDDFTLKIQLLMNKVVGERTLKTYTKPMQMSYPTF